MKLPVAIIAAFIASVVFTGVINATPEPEGGMTCTRAEPVVTSPCIEDFPFPWDGFHKVDMSDAQNVNLFCQWESSKLPRTPILAPMPGNYSIVNRTPEVLYHRAYALCALRFLPTASMLAHLAFLDAQLLRTFPLAQANSYEIAWAGVSFESIVIGSERDAFVRALR